MVQQHESLLQNGLYLFVSAAVRLEQPLALSRYCFLRCYFALVELSFVFVEIPLFTFVCNAHKTSSRV